jgi:allantoinase
MSIDLLLKNGVIVNEDGKFEGSIAVKDGRVAELLAPGIDIPADEVIDLQENILFPGMVDPHAHFNEPGRTHWEGYKTGTMAAAAGGITTVMDMPLNSIPSTVNRKALELKRESVKDQPVIDVAQWGGLVNNNIDDLGDLDADGVVACKGFMCNSGIEDFKHITDDLLYAGLKRMGELGNLASVHAENDHLTAYLTAQLQKAGRNDRAAWCEAHPPFEELEAIQRAAYLAKVTGGNLHVVHITVPEGIRHIAVMKKEGVHVTSETCPHYLFFDEDDFERIGPAAKCGPPIRLREAVEGLWKCVLEGLVDVIGSDHSPCNWEEKEKGMDNIWLAWGGISGIQTSLPVILTEGYHKRGLSLPDIVRMMSSNPARIFGLYPKKGSLMPGSDADFAIVDLVKEWKLTKDQLLYKNKHSAYVGSTFKGKVLRTIVRGKTVYADGQILVQPGYGNILRREHRYGEY